MNSLLVLPFVIFYLILAEHDRFKKFLINGGTQRFKIGDKVRLAIPCYKDENHVGTVMRREETHSFYFMTRYSYWVDVWIDGRAQGLGHFPSYELIRS